MSYRHDTAYCRKCGWTFIVLDVPSTDCYIGKVEWFCPHCGHTAKTEGGAFTCFVATHRAQIDQRIRKVLPSLRVSITDSDRKKFVRNDNILRRLAVKEGAL